MFRSHAPARGLAVVVALLANLPLSAAEQQSKSTQRPNFIIVLADDLGWGDLSCYGHPIIQTPNLDHFARQGMRFTQCYSASAVCSPSRSAILTGRTPYRNGVFTWIPEGSDIHMRTSEITLATLLRRLGYTTCHVGKWHLNGQFNSAKQPQPNDHGFDWWLATQNNAAPSHKNPVNFVRNGTAVGPLEGYSSQIVAEEAIRWLTKERDPTKPFLLDVWFHEPHLPIESNSKFINRYPELASKEPDKAQHHANVTQLDHAFGMLLKALDDLKLAENTFIIFTSDNGPEGDGLKGRTRGSTGGLRGRKRSVYEGGIRVPGIMRWPGRVRPGSTSEQPIVGSDIFSTLCAISKVPLPKDRPIDGVSFLPALDGNRIDRKTPLYWRCNIAPGEFKVAMRDGDWTILANEKMTKFELYNLKDDVAQTKNVAAMETEQFERLRKMFTRLNAEIEAEGPTWWQGYEQKKKKAN